MNCKPPGIPGALSGAVCDTMGSNVRNMDFHFKFYLKIILKNAILFEGQKEVQVHRQVYTHTPRKRDREREGESSNCWFILQMPATARAGLELRSLKVSLEVKVCGWQEPRN